MVSINNWNDLFTFIPCDFDIINGFINCKSSNIKFKNINKRE